MLQATALLGRAQLCASSGDAAAAGAALAEAAAVLGGMPAESAQHLRTHHWLLATMLQLWMGETLALQQAGERKRKFCNHSTHGNPMMIPVCIGNMEDFSRGMMQTA